MVKKKSSKMSKRNSKNSFNRNLIIGVVVVLVLAVVAFSFGGSEEGEGLGSYLDFTSYYDLMMGAVGLGDDGGDEFAGMMGAPCSVDGDCDVISGEYCSAGFCMGGTGGGCSPACTGDQICYTGICVDCIGDDDCASGEYCSAGYCMPVMGGGDCIDTDGITPINEGGTCTTINGDSGTCNGGICAKQCSDSSECTVEPNEPLCHPGGICLRCDANGHSDTCASEYPSTPACKTSRPGRGECVECTSDSHCSGTTPNCDTSTNTCTGCLGDSDCSGTTPICSAGVCSACVSGTQCTNKDSANPACKTDGSCGPCSNSGECDGTMNPICSSGTCVPCGTNTECSNRNLNYPICNSGQCNQCSGDFECPDVNNAKCTSSGSCGPCDDDEQCHPSTSKSQCSSGTCVDCPSDQWCNDNIDEGLLCKSGKCDSCDSMTECVNSPDYGTGYSCIFNSGVGNICDNS